MTETPEHRIDVLERQMHSLRTEVRTLDKWLSTISSPPWKRLYWFIRGYRLWRLGRWYGKEYEDGNRQQL